MLALPRRATAARPLTYDRMAMTIARAIELLAVAGAAYGVLDGRDGDVSFNSAFVDVLDDGLNHNDVAFRHTFPYVAQAQSGQTHIHQNPVMTVYLPLIQKAALSL